MSQPGSAPILADTLAWPREAATACSPAAVLTATGSNIVLDLHGDPVRARMTIFSDGNHHMALADVVARFAAHYPAVDDIFYATTPPRILIDALTTGRLGSGNLMLSVRPNLFISPHPVVERLHQAGRVGTPVTFASSKGTAILVRKGNPLAIRMVGDLLRRDVRLALSNPETEASSFAVYSAAIVAGSSGAAVPQEIVAYLQSNAVIKSRLIHHREIPELLASGRADASLVYTHLALRYVRIFPDDFAMLPATTEPVTTYAIALVGAGGHFGRSFIDFMLSREAGETYLAHGLQPVALTVLTPQSS